MTPCNWTNRCRYDAVWTVTTDHTRRVPGTNRLEPTTKELKPSCGNHLAMVLARHVRPGQSVTVVRAEE